MNTRTIVIKEKKDDFFDKKTLQRNTDYLLTKFQNEIYREVKKFMKEKSLSQKDMADRLGVSNAYISQILNGNFNFTLKKLIELGIAIGKVPVVKFRKV